MTQIHNKLNNEFGYLVGDTDKMVANAIKRGFELVNRVRLAGTQTKTWAQQTLQETEEIITGVNQFITNNGPQVMKPALASKNMWEIAYWENEISRKIRVYFLEVSNQMSELKKLNPPLSSNQLEPYLTTMLSERRKILHDLEPLSKVI